jgi:hypothetical protein
MCNIFHNDAEYNLFLVLIYDTAKHRPQVDAFKDKAPQTYPPQTLQPSSTSPPEIRSSLSNLTTLAYLFTTKAQAAAFILLVLQTSIIAFIMSTNQQVYCSILFLSICSMRHGNFHP